VQRRWVSAGSGGAGALRLRRSVMGNPAQSEWGGCGRLRAPRRGLLVGQWRPERDSVSLGSPWGERRRRRRRRQLSDSVGRRRSLVGKKRGPGSGQPPGEGWCLRSGGTSSLKFGVFSWRGDRQTISMAHHETSSSWHLAPGETILRKHLHARYGASNQGGICYSKDSNNVFIFTDPAEGELHGYLDLWMDDGRFHYTGQGKLGDQRMEKGNRRILNHRVDNTRLRLFSGSRGQVEYMGEFEVDEQDPWYETDAPESESGRIRRVIVFRLVPVDVSARAPEVELAEILADGTNEVKSISIESGVTETSFVHPSREVYTADRKESQLVRKFAAHVDWRGYNATRRQIKPKDERRPLFTDMYIDGVNLLVEAKGSVTREDVRMAIGQLADYRRFLDSPQGAVLLPSRPRCDLLDLIEVEGYGVIWEGEPSMAKSRRSLEFEALPGIESLLPRRSSTR
jgi:hypothetical protein